MTRFPCLFRWLISGTTLQYVDVQKQQCTGTNPKSEKRNGFCHANENKSI